MNSSAILVSTSSASPNKQKQEKKQNENIVVDTMPKRPMTTASPINRTANNMNEQSLPATSHEMIQEDYADEDFNEDE